MTKKLREEEYRKVSEKMRETLFENFEPFDSENYQTPEYRDGSYFENKRELDKVEKMSPEEVEEYVNNINQEKIKTLRNKYSDSENSVLLNLLRSVKNIQDSDISYSKKIDLIKNELWTKHNAKGKLLIGGLFGTLFGLAIFGTGGIGIVALGGATGLWGFLAGTTGGILVSSLIQNFENKK